MASTSVAVPTSAHGYVDDAVWWGSILTDFGETVPDLAWPESVRTYAQMRRDPQLAAILKAYTLPIRRASWQVDPTGCRPEVAQLVADDLGLPVAGADEQTAARVRGVSWSDHVRLALLSLVFGFMPFEMLAEIDGAGQARLIQLSERMPVSVRTIRINHDGTLAGLDQDKLPIEDMTPEIDADRLVWHVHEREGSHWQGTSVLRPAFAPWLLKREMQRVHATSNRRFGMGVPTVEWDNGVTPTPAQHSQAQHAASAARVGETAGLALPPGAHLVLAGMSGGTPDTLKFMEWLDQQMSRMALAGFLDLGQSAHGSRALGQSFIDLFLLSIQSIADDIATTVTRQASARLVEWNWGAGEPVPAVVVNEVGSTHEVTAQAIGQLLASKAISPDPALERYLRGEFKLPTKMGTPQDDAPVTFLVGDWVEVAGVPHVPGQAVGQVVEVQGNAYGIHFTSAPANEVYRWYTSSELKPGTAPKPAAPATPVAAARRSKPRRQTAGQMALPIRAADTGSLPRPPTADETASGADFAQMQQDQDEQEQKSHDKWAALFAPVVLWLSSAASKAVADDDLAALGTLLVPAGETQDAVADLTADMTTLADLSAQRVAEEMDTQGLTVDAGQPDTDRIGQIAAATVALIAGGYAAATARKALQMAGSTAAEVAKAVTDLLDGMSTSDAGLVSDGLSGALSAAQTTGRAATLSALPTGTTWRATELLDANTCGPCSEVDGTTYTKWADAEAAYPLGGFVDCLGGLRCRGRIVAHAPK